jgi:NAD(P)H-hydrate epimerase
MAKELGVVLVLKGAGTVVAAPDGRTWTDDHHTSVLATGGTGDVLAGLIGSLLAQGLEPYQAARTGVFLHGEAGTRLGFLRGRAGILASEVAGALVEVQEAARRQQEVVVATAKRG